MDTSKSYREGQIRWWTVSLGGVFFICNTLALAAGPGTTGGNILSIPVGARAIAMGEAYTAQADDVSSLYWNPAGVAILNQSQGSFMYNQYLQDAGYSHAAVATPLENGGLGASVSYLTFGKITGYDSAGAPSGDVNAYSAVGTLGGVWLGDFWSMGFNMKGIQGSLADVKATGFASDVGLNVLYPEEVLTGTLRLGATLRNLGTGLKFINERDPFPTEWRLGVAAVQMLERKLNLSLDYGKARDNTGAVYAGAEYWLIPYIALRTGYAGNHTESTGLRAGLGLKVKDVSFDYAYGQYGDLGMTNRFELTVRFGAIRPLLTPEERKILRRGKQAMRQERFGEAVLLFDSLIQMEPRYKPVRRLVKTAMVGLEKQEKMAKQMNTFNYTVMQKGQGVGEDPSMNDIESLLNLAESGSNAQVAGAKAPSKEKRR